MSNQIVPLTSQPNQLFTAQLTVDGEALVLNLGMRWSYMAGYWVLDIYSAQGESLLTGIPVVTGVWPAANLLAQYGYLAIGSAYVLSNGSQNDYPDDAELGSSFYLLWGDTVK